MHKPIIIITLCTSLLTGCIELGSLKIAQDRPEDIAQLLENNEFSRARRLTERFPAVATAELQAQLSTQEISYENSTLTDANKLESTNELFGAVQLLSSALQQLPHSQILLEYRNRLEEERLENIRTNEQQQIIARAEYILNQRTYYQQQNNLEAPNLIKRWEEARNNKEMETLSEQLSNYGKDAFERDDSQIAQKCLQLSNKLSDNPEARSLLDRINITSNEQHEAVKQQASINKAKKENRTLKSQVQKTERLLKETRQALLDDDLVVARASFIQMPSTANRSKEFLMLQETLDQTINSRVTQLTSRGDAEYRTDKVITAINTWSEALKLDPENQSLKERLDRAGRVLVKLEQIKQLQGK